jgi:hypothetical protein
MATKVAIEVDVKTGEANDDIIALREELEKVKQTQKEMSDQFKAGFEAAEKGAKGASKGMTGFGNSIGGVLKSLGLVAIAAEVFMFIRDLLMKNQAVMDAFNTATIAFEIIVKKLFDTVSGLVTPMKEAFENPLESLKAIGSFIKERLVVIIGGFVNQFIALGDIMKAAFELDWDGVTKGAEKFGEAVVQTFTATTKQERASLIESVTEFANETIKATKAAVDQADALVKLRNEVKLLEADQRALILVRQKEAEEQRQIRDDITKTLAQRIEANEKLGKIQAKQLEEETAIANKRIELAERELALDKNNVDLQVALKDARTELADVEERIAGQKSEQLTNQVALEKELFDLQTELAKVGKEQRELEFLELEQYYAALEEQARLAGDTTTDIEGAKQEALAKLRKKFRDEDLKNEKKLRDDKIKLQQDYLSAAGGVLGAIDQLVAASGQNSKEAVALQKTLAIAQIAIDTAKAIVGAIAQAQSVPYPGNLVAIATGVAAVVAGIASAVQTLNTADVPGGSAPPPQAPQTATAPAIQQATAGTTELGGVEQAQLAPIQAYVVETEVTGNQNNVNQIESQATFGG